MKVLPSAPAMDTAILVERDALRAEVERMRSAYAHEVRVSVQAREEVARLRDALLGRNEAVVEAVASHFSQQFWTRYQEEARAILLAAAKALGIEDALRMALLTLTEAIGFEAATDPRLDAALAKAKEVLE